MKARHEFTSDLEYLEYLKFYYAGIALNSMLSNPSRYGITVSRIIDRALETGLDMAAAIKKQLL